MDIKLLALDIDGTLTNRMGEVSEKNRLAVRRAIEAGIHVVVATGRGRIASRPIWKILDLHGPSINYGGAMITETLFQIPGIGLSLIRPLRRAIFHLPCSISCSSKY